MGRQEYIQDIGTLFKALLPDPASTPGMGVDSRLVREHLDKVLACSSFAGALRIQQFLRFVVEETLEGRASEIKESLVALRVFGRRSDFDSHSDSVVRVQATYLRKRLREYYRTEGQRDAVVIELPPGAYVPAFRPAAELPVPVRRRRRWLPAAAALAVLAAAASLWILGRMARDTQTSIAVLPFAVLDAAPQSNYLAEGIAEDLMTSLARSPGLRVVARTSAFQFRGKDIGARSVGHELGASVLLEGSIRGGRDHLKITAQLVNAANGFNLWSESWEGSASDAPLYEEQIVRAVRQALGKPLARREANAAAAAIHAPSPSAQEPYWRGRILLSKAPIIQQGSIPFLEQAVQADPEYAPAHAALATAYAMALYHGFLYPREEPLKKARREGARALELDPGSAEAHASLALLSFAFDHDWAAAQRSFEKALELNPSDARAHMLYAQGLVTRGRFSEAVAHVDQARILDPLSFAATTYLAIALYCAGRYDESIAAARLALATDPGYAVAHLAIGRGLALKGDFPKAIAECELAIQKYGREPWILSRMGYALARAGRTGSALAIVKEIDGRPDTAVQIAFIYAGLGDNPRALDALDRAFQEGDVDLNFMAVDPMLATLRAEPRFLALKLRMGL